jgi:hypothetical protein
MTPTDAVLAGAKTGVIVNGPFTATVAVAVWLETPGSEPHPPNT